MTTMTIVSVMIIIIARHRKHFMNLYLFQYVIMKKLYLLTIIIIIFQCIIIHFKINNLQGYEMVSFDTVPVPPPVEDPEEKKEVEFPPSSFSSLVT